MSEKDSKVKRSGKFNQVKDSLAPELKKYYEQLVDDYGFLAMKNYGRNWVAYEVLADLIREGWRPTK